MRKPQQRKRSSAPVIDAARKASQRRRMASIVAALAQHPKKLEAWLTLGEMKVDRAKRERRVLRQLDRMRVSAPAAYAEAMKLLAALPQRATQREVG